MTKLVNSLIALIIISPRLWCDGGLTHSNNILLNVPELVDYDMSHRYRASLIGEKNKWSVYICGKLVHYDNDFLANRKPQAITCLGIDF